MDKKYLFIIGIFLLVITPYFVSSAPPVTTVQQFPEGFILSEQQIHTFKFGEPMRYGFILENSTNGKTVNDSDIHFCRIVTSNSQGFNTQVSNFSYIEEYHLWGIELNQTEVLRHFPEIGLYNYLISCQDDVGGALNGIFDINKNGPLYDLTTARSILLIGVLVIILTLLILTIRGMILIDNFGWNFGFLNIAYILLNIFFYTSWKVFSLFLISIPTAGAALHTLWIISNIAWIPFILGQVAYILLKITEESQIKKLVKMGYSQDEASSRVKRRK